MLQPPRTNKNLRQGNKAVALPVERVEHRKWQLQGPWPTHIIWLVGQHSLRCAHAAVPYRLGTEEIHPHGRTSRRNLRGILHARVSLVQGQTLLTGDQVARIFSYQRQHHDQLSACSVDTASARWRNVGHGSCARNPLRRPAANASRPNAPAHSALATNSAPRTSPAFAATRWTRVLQHVKRQRRPSAPVCRPVKGPSKGAFRTCRCA
jgi:hypothetical protein